LRDRDFLALPTTVFQTAAFAKFARKSPDFEITDPRTPGTLTESP
jgi:hypothetical protein